MSDPLQSSNPPKRRSPLRWVYRFVGALVLLVALLIIFLPNILSSDFVTQRVRGAVSEASGGLADFEGMSLGWGSFELTGLRISNPDEPGMPKEPAVELAKAAGEFSAWSLIWNGEMHVTMHADAPVLRVHRGADGRSNLQAIQERLNASVQTTTTKTDPQPGGSGSGGGPAVTTNTAPLKLDFQINSGQVILTDAELGVERRIEDLQLHVGNQAVGTPLRFRLGGRILEAGSEDGSFSLLGDIPLDGSPPERIDLNTRGVDLAKWAALVNGMLAEPFERLNGVVSGDLSAQLQSGGEAWRVTGNLKVDKPDIAGGPLGPGRGVRAESWVFEPQFLYDSKTHDTSLEGSTLDLGFVKLIGLSPARAKELIPESMFEPGKRFVPLGFTVETDLSKLAQQPGLLPEGAWAGSIRQELALLIDPAVEPAKLNELPFRLVTKLADLAMPESMLPANAQLPKEAQLEVTGTAKLEDGSLAPTQIQLRSEGVEGNGTVSLTGEQALSSEFELTLDPATAAWIQPFLPQNLQLSGKSVLRLVAKGSFAEGGAPLQVTGAYNASTVSYLGNQLSGLAQEFSWKQGGRFEAKTPARAKLNGGPLAISAGMGTGEDPQLSFKLQWSGGKSEYGMTPALRYALPLLAGLPTEDLEKVTGIDFAATTSLTLEAKGPIPKEGQSFVDIYKSWAGGGEIQLANGGFTPSSSLADLLKFSGSGPGGRFTFDAIQGGIQIVDGKLAIDGLQIGGKDGKVSISGSTSLLGDMQHKVDFTGWLAQHRDGKRILAALGNQRVVADLGGNLLSPKLEVADFAKKVLEGGLQNAVDGLLKGLGEGKKPEDALKDLLRGLRGKDK
jgi:hypothetical protein